MIDFFKQPDKWEWQPYFTIKEFTCRGSGECRMHPDFMQRLYELREQFGRPMIITSGYRCPEHNRAVSDTGGNGPHTTGRAVDIAISGKDAFDLVGLAIQHGFTGIGIKQHGPHSGRIVHLDDLTAPLYPRRTIWTYT